MAKLKPSGRKHVARKPQLRLPSRRIAGPRSSCPSIGSAVRNMGAHRCDSCGHTFEKEHADEYAARNAPYDDGSDVSEVQGDYGTCPSCLQKFKQNQRKVNELKRLRSEASAFRSMIAKQKASGEDGKEQELKNLRVEVQRLKSALAKETDMRQKAEKKMAEFQKKMAEFQKTAEDATEALLREGVIAKGGKRPRP